MYDMLTFSYLGPNNTSPYVTPAFVNVTAGSFLMETQPPQGVTAATPSAVNLLGIGNAFRILPASSQQWFLYFNVAPQQQSAGPRHMVFSLPGDMYVLPDGVNFTLNAPPTISSVSFKTAMGR